MQLQQAGLLTKWFHENLTPDSCAGVHDSKVDPVALHDVIYLFYYVFGGGLGLAVIVLILENICYRRNICMKKLLQFSGEY